MKILHLDDHTLFSEGLASVLTKYDIDIVSVYSTESAISLIETHPDFDLIITDLSLPGLDGFAFIQGIEQRQLLLPVAVLSATDDIWEIKKSLAAGVAGFIPKTYSTAKIVEAIKLMLEGEVYVPDDIKQLLAQLPSQEPENILSRQLKAYKLSKRQLEVLRLMQQGHSNEEIATILYVSKNTIKTHVKILFSAFKVSNRMECVRFGERLELI